MRKSTMVIIFIMVISAIFANIGFVKCHDFYINKALVGISDSYEGKVLVTEDEYTKMKEILSKDTADIHSLTVYSSENPLVIFDVTVPSDAGWKWGELTNETYNYEYTATQFEQNLYCKWFTFGGGVTFLITVLILFYRIPKPD